MEQPTNNNLADEFAAALEWWKEAGVDSDFADDATDWLAEADTLKGVSSPMQQIAPQPKKPIAPAATPPAKRIGGDQAGWPAELAAFQSWLLESADVDDGGAFPIVPMRGLKGSELMVIVSEPEESDRDHLLSGPQGNLLSGMMRAACLDDSGLYLTSVLRRHTPMPDWSSMAEAGLGELLSHHIALAAPKRILTFGRNIPALLGNDTAQGAAILHNFNHEGGSIPAMGVSSLAELLRSAGRRERFWQSWLGWTS
ncbi:hypothetical protein GCM10023115_16070 [Pontixanthobacter gangjinensis]|uniref:Uracil-DNA glycosylase-like domain-containing protein n=1 Tax=Pontixanthobacter gangjinensis TaxID=1028742 RepID=A0A6I4SNY6_9SPHN|nr:uracil-DNA glycosylase family protein [Pontixanthobacter gangjinensis]MXO56850.1 hypothetical protein [Pontixanthobacter gangjinensis]